MTVRSCPPGRRRLRRSSLSILNIDSFKQALKSLPVHFREVLLLCEVEEMSYQEIGEALSIPIGTVMSRLSRARKALRESMQQKVVRS